MGNIRSAKSIIVGYDECYMPRLYLCKTRNLVFVNITVKFYKFQLTVIVAYESELEKGFIVKKQLKTTSQGTKFNYKEAETEEELNNYIVMIKEMIEDVDMEIIMSKFKSKIEQLDREEA